VRYLVLSDIHGNLEALEAVLRHSRRKHHDAVLFLGDAVGYGASPNAVVDWLRTSRAPVMAIRGNHDRVCSGLDEGEYFNQYALRAVRWTGEHLERRNLTWLQNLPEGPRPVEPGLAICHGSPVDEDAYIFSGYDAQMAFDRIPEQVVFFGHSHVPSLFSADGRDGIPTLSIRLLSGTREIIPIEDGVRYLINPGSVGQPRDRDPRAAYALYDTETRRVRQYRVPYRISKARGRILKAGLPAVLGDRLFYGT
jgi:predicted phosphodiesterase